MGKFRTTMIPVRMSEADVRTLDATVNLQKAANAFTGDAWRRESRSSVIRRAIYAEHDRARAAADAKEKKGPQRRYSERGKRKGKK